MILVVFGTRPEAIKMAPIIKKIDSCDLPYAVCNTGQHKEMLEGILDFFEIKPDFNLDVMSSKQSLATMLARIIERISILIEKLSPSIVLVHGDTLTCTAVTLASYYLNVPVGHVEAGLRTGNLQHPWPEEMNRKIVGQMATINFCPTKIA